MIIQQPQTQRERERKRLKKLFLSLDTQRNRGEEKGKKTHRVEMGKKTEGGREKEREKMTGFVNKRRILLGLYTR